MLNITTTDFAHYQFMEDSLPGHRGLFNHAQLLVEEMLIRQNGVEEIVMTHDQITADVNVLGSQLKPYQKIVTSLNVQVSADSRLFT